MRYMLFIVLSCLLAACNTTTSTPTSLVEKPLVAAVERTIGDYTLTLKSATDTYTNGAKIDVVATLTNHTDEPITIGHGESWVNIGVTNMTEDYHFGYATNLPYITTTLQAGETLTTPYRFSGASYSDDQPGKRYSDDDMTQMATLQFPTGTYEMTAYFNFTNEETGEKMAEAMSIVFRVQ